MIIKMTEEVSKQNFQNISLYQRHVYMKSKSKLKFNQVLYNALIHFDSNFFEYINNKFTAAFSK